jgi:hypothetical protein
MWVEGGLAGWAKALSGRFFPSPLASPGQWPLHVVSLVWCGGLPYKPKYTTQHSLKLAQGFFQSHIEQDLLVLTPLLQSRRLHLQNRSFPKEAHARRGWQSFIVAKAYFLLLATLK